eukprot:5767667-Amphidinium_carterae.1
MTTSLQSLTTSWHDAVGTLLRHGPQLVTWHYTRTVSSQGEGARPVVAHSTCTVSTGGRCYVCLIRQSKQFLLQPGSRESVTVSPVPAALETSHGLHSSSLLVPVRASEEVPSSEGAMRAHFVPDSSKCRIDCTSGAVIWLVWVLRPVSRPAKSGRFAQRLATIVWLEHVARVLSRRFGGPFSRLWLLPSARPVPTSAVPLRSLRRWWACGASVLSPWSTLSWASKKPGSPTDSSL